MTALEHKNEVIKKSWVALIGEKEFEDGVFDENGYSQRSFLNIMPSSERRDKEIQTILRHGRIFYRPAALKGIEDNNGWVRIESEEQTKGLSVGNYYNICKVVKGEIKPLNGQVNGNIVHELYKIGNITHYRLVEKIKLPIF